jgi:hypothetical protein
LGRELPGSTPDGSTWLTGGDEARLVFQGGSLFYLSSYLRSADCNHHASVCVASAISSNIAKNL